MTNTTLLNGFSHPGDKTFDECDRKFRTSNFADGSVLFYETNMVHGGIINGLDNKREVKEICIPCSKYEGCLVHEILIKTLDYVEHKKKK